MHYAISNSADARQTGESRHEQAGGHSRHSAREYSGPGRRRCGKEAGGQENSQVQAKVMAGDRVVRSRQMWRKEVGKRVVRPMQGSWQAADESVVR